MHKKGTIVLVPFPFTDLSGNKVRPALVVSVNKIGSDVVVVFITSQNKLKEKFQIPVSPNKLNGLKTKSKIVCSKIATLETKIILGELGVIDTEIQKKVDTNLKKILGIV